MTEVFDNYAQYYDLFYDDKDYPKEAAYIVKLIKKHHRSAKQVLELGCGTGRHAELLAKAGYDIDGVDQSTEMLKIAQTQLKSALKKKISFAQGDVRTFRAGKIYDVVTALFHIVSYQVSNQDVVAMFCSAAEHLERGGVFLFDTWYGPAVLSTRPEVRLKERSTSAKRATRVAIPDFYPNENRVDVNYRLLVTDKKTQKTEEFSETHRMRYYFAPELEQLLDQTGFELLGFQEWLTGQPAGLDTWGVCFIARKR